jgi:hypothetical protein
LRRAPVNVQLKPLTTLLFTPNDCTTGSQNAKLIKVSSAARELEVRRALTRTKVLKQQVRLAANE